MSERLDTPTGAPANGAKRRQRATKVPIGLRPAPSDDELETNILERWQGLGVIMTIFLALFLPAYWLFFENQRGTRAAVEQRVDSIERGKHIFALAAEEEPGGHGAGFQAQCAQCHGVNAEGGVRKGFIAPGSAPGAKPVDFPVPSLNDVFIRRIVGSKQNEKDAYNYVYEKIARGVPGTPMPSWGLGYGGPMNDQQIEDVINYLISLQDLTQLPKGTVLAAGAHEGAFSRLIAFAAEKQIPEGSNQ
jgi:mono/diheme cytochrome c family protein